MKHINFLLLFLISCNCAFKTLTNEPATSVFYAILSDKNISVVPIEIPEEKLKWTAKAVWESKNYNITGWSTLEIESNERIKDSKQAYAAGFLEGYLSKDLIFLHILNSKDQISSNETEIITFLVNNMRWLKLMIENNPFDPYYHHVNLMLIQFHGLYNGFIRNHVYNENENVLESMIKDIEPYFNLMSLQLMGDISELINSIKNISDPFIADHCSVIIKLLPDKKDLYVSHNSWTVYNWMLRVLKRYKLNYHLNDESAEIVPGSDISFSSYPGTILSLDDFYIINSRLVVTETTIGNANAARWKFVNEKSIFYWIRVMVSNRLAHTGRDWANLFSLQNSGTYNNELMIIDYKKFIPGEFLKKGLLTVLEQAPGMIHWEDKTEELLSKTYWSSFNIPYYSDIYENTGKLSAYKKYGDFFSHSQSPRAKIFERDHHKVKDVDTLISLMRYNNFTKDPLSKCECEPPFTGIYAIAARADLSSANGKYPFFVLGHRNFGAIDLKLTTYEMSKKMEIIAINGPTYDDEDIKPFIWSESSFNDTNHYGHPDKFAYQPFKTKWSL